MAGVVTSVPVKLLKMAEKITDPDTIYVSEIVSDGRVRVASFRRILVDDYDYDREVLQKQLETEGEKVQQIVLNFFGGRLPEGATGSEKILKQLSYDPDNAQMTGTAAFKVFVPKEAIPTWPTS